MTDHDIGKIDSTVLKLHRQCGHFSTRALARAPRARGANEQTRAIALRRNCPECQEGKSDGFTYDHSCLEKAEALWHMVQVFLL